MSKRLRQRWRQNWLLGVLQRRRDRCEPRRWAAHRGALLRGQLARREMCQRWGLAGTVVTLTMRRRAAARPLQMQVRLHQARVGCGLWEHSVRLASRCERTLRRVAHPRMQLGQQSKHVDRTTHYSHDMEEMACRSVKYMNG